MRELLLADMDGTVLKSGLEIPSPAVTAAVHQMHEENRSFVPVTSRSHELMIEPDSALHLRDKAVLDGGATIYDFAAGHRDRELSRWLSESTTREVVSSIGRLCAKIYYDEFSQLRTPETIDLSEIKDEVPAVFAVYHERDEERITGFLAGIAGLSLSPNNYDEGENMRCVQVLREGVDKKSGVELLLESDFSHLTGDEMAAAGDGETDEFLLRALRPGGLRMVMGNAREGLKNVAREYPDHAILPHVNDDGLAYGIRQYIVRG